MRKHKLVLDVPVNNVAAAVSFYCRAFKGRLQSRDPSGARRVRLSAVIVLRVINEAGYLPDAFNQDDYQKGRTPRLEMRVGDVRAWVEEAIAAGATLRGRTPSSDDEGPVSYAQILDPFGHLWSFTELWPEDKTGRR